MGGTFDMALESMVLLSTLLRQWERWGSAMRGACTLLGPEGPGVGTHAVLLAFMPHAGWCGGVGGPPVL